jgi:MFS family permease
VGDEQVAQAGADAQPAADGVHDSLWRSPDFVKFISGQSISLLGTQFTLLALPLSAVVVLHATAAQMGILYALQFGPALAIGPFVGVWLDRGRRRPAMVLSQVGSMVVLGTIPLAFLAHALTLQLVFVVACLAGVASTVYTIAQNSFLPSLVDRRHLVDANSHYAAAQTAAQLAGPSAVGLLMRWVSPPLAIAVDTASFLVGAVTAASIRTKEAKPVPAEVRRHVIGEIRDGFRALWADPIVRPIVTSLSLLNLGTYTTIAVYVLFFVGRRGVSPTLIGLIFAAGALSSLLGARLARRFVRRWGVGLVLIGSGIWLSAGRSVIVLAAWSPGVLVIPFLLTGQVIGGGALMTFNVLQQSIRQAVIPSHLLGRIQSSVLVTVWTAQVMGALLGGALGQWLGLPLTFLVGGLLNSMGLIPLVTSRLRSFRELPARRATTGADRQ